MTAEHYPLSNLRTVKYYPGDNYVSAPQGYIVFCVDPVSVCIGVGIASCLHSIS